MANISDAALHNFLPLYVGNLRDGALGTIGRTSRESAIPRQFRFHGPRWDDAFTGDAANRVPPLPPAVLVNASVRSSFSQIVHTAVDEARIAHNAAQAAAAGAAPAVAAVPPAAPGAAAPAAPAAPAAFDHHAARLAAVADPTNRVQAIALGTAHASCTYSYRLTNNDLVRTEVGGSVYAINPPAGAVDDDDYAALAATKTAGWTATLASGHDAGAYNTREYAAQNFAELTEAEYDAASSLFIMATAAITRAGTMLLKSEHHYFSDAESRRRHAAIEREVWAKASEQARAWWRQNGDVVKDMVWHKAPHVVNPYTLEDLAGDPVSAQRLLEAGYGSMAVGLPAQEDLFNRAGSYLALLESVSALVGEAGHTVTLNRVRATRDALIALPRRGITPANTVNMARFPNGPPAGQGLPAAITTRAQAAKQYLEPALDEAKAAVAWMFGWYREVCADAGVRVASQEGSLMRSWSLRKAMEMNVGQSAKASQMYTARKRWLRAQAEEGNFETVNYAL